MCPTGYQTLLTCFKFTDHIGFNMVSIFCLIHLFTLFKILTETRNNCNNFNMQICIRKEFYVKLHPPHQSKSGSGLAIKWGRSHLPYKRCCIFPPVSQINFRCQKLIEKASGDILSNPIKISPQKRIYPTYIVLRYQVNKFSQAVNQKIIKQKEKGSYYCNGQHSSSFQ